MTNFRRNPSVKYRKAVEALRDLMTEAPDSGGVTRAFAEAVSEQWRKDYAIREKLKPVSAHVCVSRLLGKRCPEERDRSGDAICESYMIPRGDHLSEWRAEDGSRRLVSQPYGMDYESLKELVTFCERLGLEADIDAYPAWHFPGSTLFVELRRKDTAKTRREPLQAPGAKKLQ